MGTVKENFSLERHSFFKAKLDREFSLGWMDELAATYNRSVTLLFIACLITSLYFHVVNMLKDIATARFTLMVLSLSFLL